MLVAGADCDVMCVDVDVDVDVDAGADVVVLAPMEDHAGSMMLRREWETETHVNYTSKCTCQHDYHPSLGNIQSTAHINHACDAHTHHACMCVCRLWRARRLWLDLKMFLEAHDCVCV